MKLTPQDILNQSFAGKLRGFDPDEVKNFLMMAAETLESEIQEKEELRQRMEKLRESLTKLEKREDVLRDTLIAAQKFSSEIKANAHKEAELIIKEAEMKGEEILKHAASRQAALREEIKTLRFKRNDIESDLLRMLESLKELVESYRREDGEFDKIEYIGG
jgi:cell division initiation protein